VGIGLAIVANKLYFRTAVRITFKGMIRENDEFVAAWLRIVGEVDPLFTPANNNIVADTPGDNLMGFGGMPESVQESDEHSPLWTLRHVLGIVNLEVREGYF
jgi:hypothetical protein